MKIKIAVLMLLGIFFYLLQTLAANAQLTTFISINNNLPEIVSENNIEKNILINYKPGSNWKLVLKLVSNGFYNINDPYAVIQPEHIIIRNNKKLSVSQLSLNEGILIDFGNNDEYANSSITLEIRPIENIKPGKYNGIIQFQLSNQDETRYENVHVSFKLPYKQEIYTLPNKVDISVDASNSFKKGFLQESKNVSKILVKSNSNWKLIIRANKDEESDISHYFKVVSVPYGAKSLCSANYDVIPNNPIAIIEGLPTFSYDGQHLESREIDIIYAFKTSIKSFTPSGNYPINVTYSILPM